MNLMDKQNKKNISDSNSDEPKDMLGFEAALVGNGKNVLVFQPHSPIEEILVKQNCKVRNIVTSPEPDEIPEISSSYDVIVVGDYFQYVRDPKMLLDKFHSYLNTGGYLVCSITNTAHAYNRIKLLNGEFGYPQPRVGFRQLQFFTLETIIHFLNDSNYSMTKLYRETQDLDLIHNKDLKYFTIPDELIESIKTDPESLVSKYVFSVIPKSNDNSGTYDYLKEFPRSMVTERLKELIRYYKEDLTIAYDKKLDEKNSQIDQLKRKLNDTENK